MVEASQVARRNPSQIAVQLYLRDLLMQRLSPLKSSTLEKLAILRICHHAHQPKSKLSELRLALTEQDHQFRTCSTMVIPKGMKSISSKERKRKPRQLLPIWKTEKTSTRPKDPIIITTICCKMTSLRLRCRSAIEHLWIKITRLLKSH